MKKPPLSKERIIHWLMTFRIGTLTNTGTISGSGSIEPRLKQDKPASLTVKRIENGAVTLEANGDGKTDLEYSADGTTWQVSPTFTGVDLSEGRTFSARYKADGHFYQASAPASLTFCPVKLDAIGGTIASGKDVAYYIVGQGVTLPAKDDVKRPGYAFAGWYANAALTGSPVTGSGAASAPLTAESPVFTLRVIQRAALPQTGDSSSLLRWAALLGACCAGLWCMHRRHR